MLEKHVSTLLLKVEEEDYNEEQTESATVRGEQRDWGYLQGENCFIKRTF